MQKAAAGVCVVRAAAVDGQMDSQDTARTRSLAGHTIDGQPSCGSDRQVARAASPTLPEEGTAGKLGPPARGGTEGRDRGEEEGPEEGSEVPPACCEDRSRRQ